MKKILTVFLIFPIMYLHSKIELLDRIAIIVDDGVVMESQINKSFNDLKRNYQSQGMEMPPKNIILDQIKEKLIIEELQLQMANRAGVKISDAELNSALTRLASNNQMSLEEFIAFIENNNDSYEDVREQVRKEMSMENTVKAYCNNLPQLLNRCQFSKGELALFGFAEDFYEKRKKRSEQRKQSLENRKEEK